MSLFSAFIKQWSNGTRLLAAGVMAASVLTATPATAAQELVVEADRAKIIRLAGSPSTIVIGNPLYASVSVKGNMLIIQGKHFGSTNVIIMDADGNMLAEMDVTVVADKRDEYLTVYRRGQTGIL